MQLLDEFETKWLVKAGDPANDLVNTLARRGFELVVLPRVWYTTGDITREITYTPGDTILAARFSDCTGVLLSQI